MTKRSLSRLRASSAIALLGGALWLAACSPQQDAAANNSMAMSALPALPATLPLAQGDATAPAYAPSVGHLPAGHSIRAVRVADPGAAYAYAEDAYDFGNAVYDAPPDYGFDYAGVEPWAWQGYDSSLTFAEPVDNGYRYYYYRPGADEPYFIRDADYGYGYDNGQLAVIYGSDGGIVPYGAYGPRLDYAGRYLARADALYAASRRNERRAVIAANWAARSAEISASRARWAQVRERQAAWRDFQQRRADAQRDHWQEERVRRQADVQRFAEWRRQDFRPAPPPRVIPAAWQQAHWARDDRRYVPVGGPRAPAAAFAQQRAAREAERAQQATLAGAPAAMADRRAQEAQVRQQEQEALQQQLTQRRQAEASRLQARGQADAARQQQVAARQQEQVRRQQHDEADRVRRQQARAGDAARQQAEASRLQQRDRRQQANTARQQARVQEQAQRRQHDQQRAQQEAGRAQAQAQRQQAMQARQQQQATRQQQRARADAGRQQEQAAREQQRAQAEAGRQQQQTARAQQAQAREQQRAQADAGRQAAQAARQQAQAARQAAPAPRQQPGPPAGGQPGGGGRGGHGGRDDRPHP